MKNLGIVAVILLFGLVFQGMNMLRSEIRNTKVDVALLQQQVIVLLVGQGHKIQEGE